MAQVNPDAVRVAELNWAELFKAAEKKAIMINNFFILHDFNLINNN